MARILVTGMSGVGKSSLLVELGRRGHRVVDTDYDGYSEWLGGEQLWREARIQQLLTAHDSGLLFISGTARNQVKFYPQLDHVVLLSAPVPLLVQRLTRRTNNPYGKDPAELAEALRLQQTIEPILREHAALEVDTSVPVAQVADSVLDHILHRTWPHRPNKTCTPDL